MTRLKRYFPWVVAVLALLAAVTFGVLWQQESARASEEDELRAAATEFITDLTSISADTVEADAEAIKEWAVGDFADEAEVFYGPKAIEAVVEADATTEGDVQELYVQSLAGGEGSVFAVVNYTVTNAGTEEPKSDIVRMSVELIQADGDWKVNSVRVLESPGTALPSAG